MPASFSFGKDKHLKSRKSIEALFKSGRSIHQSPFRLIFRFEEGEGQALLAGFSAPTKNFKKAVHRNRVKRLMKEGYRLHYTRLEATLLATNRRLSMFLIYTAKELPTQDLATEKISLLLTQLIKKINEGFAKGA